MTSDRTIASLRAAAASARLRQRSARRAALLAVQDALARYAETFEGDPAGFAARVLLEIDTALPRDDPDPHGATGPAREASRMLQRATADLCLLAGD